MENIYTHHKWSGLSNGGDQSSLTFFCGFADGHGGLDTFLSYSLWWFVVYWIILLIPVFSSPAARHFLLMLGFVYSNYSIFSCLRVSSEEKLCLFVEKWIFIKLHRSKSWTGREREGSIYFKSKYIQWNTILPQNIWIN